MSEIKSNGWGIYAIRKLVEYAGIAIAVWQLGLPALNVYIEERIVAYNKEHNAEKSFRTLLSEETQIPSDRIHIVFGEWFNKHKQQEKLLDSIFPIIQEEVVCIMPRLRILPSGRGKWTHVDGQDYDAYIGEDGFYWFYNHGLWQPCKF